MTAGGGNQLVSVLPDELKFIYELEKQSYCDLKVANKTEHYVAFKVKTTSPKKYFVRPNTGVIQPWDSCIIRVTLQAQREYPPDLHCRDKFLLQSSIVPPHTDVDELPQDTFSKDGGKTLEECKLKVVYVSPSSPHVSFGTTRTLGDEEHVSETISTIQRLKEERDAALKLTQQLQHHLETLRRRKGQKKDEGFTLKFALIVGLLGIIVGYLLNFAFSSPNQSI